MIVFILDASVVGSWALPDEAHPDGDRLLELASMGSIAAPFHFPAEVGNLILTAERRRRIDSAQSDLARQAIALLSLEIDACDPDLLWDRAYPLAVRHRLTLYDALYLELAIRIDRPLASFDGDLRKAARAEGVLLA